MIIFEVLSRDDAFVILTSLNHEYKQYDFARACFLYGRKQQIENHEQMLLWQKSDNFLCDVFAYWHQLNNQIDEKQSCIFLAYALNNAYVYQDLEGQKYITKAITCNVSKALDHEKKVLKHLQVLLLENSDKEQLPFLFYLANAYYNGWGTIVDLKQAKVLIKKAIDILYQLDLSFSSILQRDYLNAYEHLYYLIKKTNY